SEQQLVTDSPLRGHASTSLSGGLKWMGNLRHPAFFPVIPVSAQTSGGRQQYQKAYSEWRATCSEGTGQTGQSARSGEDGLRGISWAQIRWTAKITGSVRRRHRDDDLPRNAKPFGAHEPGRDRIPRAQSARPRLPPQALDWTGRR